VLAQTLEVEPLSLSSVGVLVMIDGQVRPPGQAQVSVFDRGFLYGDAVFETIRTYGGAPFELDAHLARLERSAARVLIPLPVPLDTIGREVLDAVRQADNPESYVRLMLTRGSGELDLAPDVASYPLRVIIVGPLKPLPASAYTQGVGVVTYRTLRVADATDAVGAKVTNYLVSVLAMGKARKVGAVEALVVDRNDCVVEGATSNVFAVLDGSLVTPPEDVGILAGITRGRVLQLARELGISTVLRPLPLSELRGAQEVFISSSIRELLPVVRVDGDRVGRGNPGPVTARLLAAFRKKIKEDKGL
jgi:branched-chain amino acid aminotransferase